MARRVVVLAGCMLALLAGSTAGRTAEPVAVEPLKECVLANGATGRERDCIGSDDLRKCGSGADCLLAEMAAWRTILLRDISCAGMPSRCTQEELWFRLVTQPLRACLSVFGESGKTPLKSVELATCYRDVHAIVAIELLLGRLPRIAPDAGVPDSVDH